MKSIIGQRIKNISKPNYVTAEESKRIANSEITLRDFNPAYDQIIKRISTTINSGLRCGSPPGVVT